MDLFVLFHGWVTIRPSESANSENRGMDLFDSQRQGRLRDRSAEFSEGTNLPFSHPLHPSGRLVI